MEAIIQPTVIPRNNYIASQVTLDFVAACFITVRLGTNWSHHRKFFADDYFCVVGLLFVISYSITSSMMNSSFNSSPNNITVHFITGLAAACIFTATAAMYFAKLPILIFLLRTFGVKKWLRYISYCLMVLTALAFLASALWTGVNCSPGLQDDVDQAFLFSCVSATFYTTVSRNSISLAVDVIIFIMPLPLVARLKMAPRKKIGVALVFLAGSLGIAAGVVSLYYQADQAKSTSSNITNAMLATVIECCVILIVSCSASLRLLWTHYLKKDLAFLKFGYSGSSSTPHSNKPQKSNPSDASTPIRVTTRHYIELSEFTSPGMPSYEAAATHGQPGER